MDPGVASTVLKKIVELSKAKGKTTEQGHETELRAKVGKLIYLKTRPDLAYATGFMARFCHSAGKEEVRNVNNIFLYAKKDPSRGIILNGDPDYILEAYADADLGGNPHSVKSTSGVVICMGNGGALLYRSKLQRMVADSTGMAEVYAAHRACRELQFFIDLCKELAMPIVLPIPLCVDNESVFKLNSGAINHAGSKHYRIAQAFIVDMINAGKIKLVKIDTKKNRSDQLTKALGRQLHGVHSSANFGD
jgi:hypothetical protein